MAKRKNHTAHNQSRKAHRNGIKRPLSQKYRSLDGMDPKLLRNLRYAKKWELSAGQQLKVAKERKELKDVRAKQPKKPKPVRMAVVKPAADSKKPATKAKAAADPKAQAGKGKAAAAPAAKKPAEKKPAEKKPAEKKPAEKKPATKPMEA